MGNLAFANRFVEGILFYLRHKIDALRSPLGKELVVIGSPIIDHNGARRKGKLSGNLNVRHLPFGNPGKGGQGAVMVQKEV